MQLIKQSKSVIINELSIIKKSMKRSGVEFSYRRKNIIGVIVKLDGQQISNVEDAFLRVVPELSQSSLARSSWLTKDNNFEPIDRTNFVSQIEQDIFFSFLNSSNVEQTYEQFVERANKTLSNYQR